MRTLAKAGSVNYKSTPLPNRTNYRALTTCALLFPVGETTREYFSKQILAVGLDYLRDGARYSMYRRLLQRNAILNVADHMSAVDAKTIYNFKKRLAHYRYTILNKIKIIVLHITN
jgi:hypothetical protein